MNKSKKSFQETLDAGLENFWETLDSIINSPSKDPRVEVDDAVMRFERRLKDGIRENVDDPDERESKIFQIEVMVNEIRDNLDRVLEVKSVENQERKKLEISDESENSQKRLDEYPKGDLKSLREKISSLDDK